MVIHRTPDQIWHKLHHGCESLEAAHSIHREDSGSVLSILSSMIYGHLRRNIIRRITVWSSIGALSFNAAGGALRSLRDLTNRDIQTLYHELFHAFMDYLTTGSRQGIRTYRRMPLWHLPMNSNAVVTNTCGLRPSHRKKGILKSDFWIRRNLGSAE